MPFKVVVQPLQKRTDKIAQLVAAAKQTLPFYEYQSRTQNLPAVFIDIALPIYRMANFRTQTAQLKYLRENPEKRAELFKSGQENEEAQRAQHRLLIELSKRGTEQIQPIFSALEEDAKQTEPLLITHTGVVVNGNRRLAAMRELFADDPKTYKSFSTIQCMVLPVTATQPEIREVEVRLQMKRETKLPYDWTDQGLAIKAMLADGVDKKQICALMSMDDESDVDAFVVRINEADIYLRDYLKQPTAYEEVGKSEQVFKELEKSVRNVKGAIEKEARRKVAHVLIANPNSLNGRVYNFRLAWGKQNAEVLQRLHEQVPLGKRAKKNDLAVDFGESDGLATIFEDLKPTLSDAAKGPQVAKLINEIVEEIDEEEKQAKNEEAGVRFASGALAQLRRIDPSNVPKKQKAELRGILTDAASLIKTLVRKL